MGISFHDKYNPLDLGIFDSTMNCSQLKLQTFVEDIQKIDGNKELNFSEILEYTKNEYTRETAQNYLDALEKNDCHH